MSRAGHLRPDHFSRIFCSTASSWNIAGDCHFLSTELHLDVRRIYGRAGRNSSERG
jgi:hypothetical protein